MARYHGPVCRLCRREGAKLFLKGDKCYKPSCPIEKRGTQPPGQHGALARRKALVGYGQQLREKQKVKRIYFVLERQFRNYFERAARMKGVTGENLLILLERRLDNAVYRAGFATSRRQARQLVVHGHIAVNGRKVDIPSFQVNVGDQISVREASRRIPQVEAAWQTAAGRGRPSWLVPVEGEEMSVRVARLPQRDDIDRQINEQLIVELYSK
ncbi:30S ribosomal protein S4 [Pyrinomonas methylaliphatogenes]|uniref:Small ribosomal subunit protein uS4 n=1 Tax=Pyrinomonas methylaliphatogenes TaxID=454194 RepID=A0A0B6X0S2_9BACT|nr:30S ribosomal protein S4 [Pyrinomonas methylaliphatogenes]MBX5479011.1 30S ribosomal protein S4 [Pyrinomonas methylaliphatogenes]CDM66139.1 ribosomal protein S4, bacterial/organelle type [Pyrinomonas methylaliphatogenes]